MKNYISTLILLSCFSFLSAQTGNEWKQKVAPTLLEKITTTSSVPFIIELTVQADVRSALHLNSKEEKASYVYQTLKETADETQGHIIEFLEQHQVPYQSLYIINAIKAEGSQELIHALALRSDVSRILDNPMVKLPEPVEWSAADNNSRSTIEWGIEKINADDVWALGFRGQGVVVGGEDTGYEWNHPALKKQYRGYIAETDTVDHNYNWHDAIHAISPLNTDTINPCGLDSKEPCDDRGHGTHTMGTMIGLDGDNEIGVAPEAKWCGCRNMERNWGSPFTYIECFQWFMAPTDLNNENPDPSKAPHVINNSWGCPEVEGCDSSNWHIMNMVVNNLRLAGIVVVVSAGNSGSGCGSINTPAAIFEGSFSVGATAINDTIAGFSSRGPVAVDSSFRIKPNVSAPGVDVRSAKRGGDYTLASGTSMAGPHVVGLVALMISANPDLAGKVDLIEDIIEQTAVPKTTDQVCGDIPGSQVPNPVYGFGRVDALAAVEAALALIPSGTEHEQPLTDIHVYPNPVTDKLIIEVEGSHNEIRFQMTDANGRIVLQRTWNASHQAWNEIDTDGIPSGIYFYQILTRDGMTQGKVFKN